ncbi:hypothetical protein FB451DRAFT_1269327 [Mycena latifolia]|nr:hypothetical protein FB451DRAFT_1269327 [Mycena latifolia]
MMTNPTTSEANNYKLAWKLPTPPHRVPRCKRVLEVWTLGGYSTIWLARTLPADGELVFNRSN